MNHQMIDLDSIADIEFELNWKSGQKGSTHQERYAAQGVNLWRDWLPKQVRRKLLGRRCDERVSVSLSAAHLFENAPNPVTIDRKRFGLPPQAGRFYPKGHLSGFAGIFPQNNQPFRCVGVHKERLDVHMAHPLAQKDLSLTMRVGSVQQKQSDRGGTSIDWVGMLADGPGMQARWRGEPTDFFSHDPFVRKDDRPDAQFYQKPRLVHHLDATARGQVGRIYRRFMQDDMQVLDLMSSWVSHLPEDVPIKRLSGLGMNHQELTQNQRLTDRQVQDLNANPKLPYEDAVFDLAVCTVSIEYLTRPLEVFAEMGRVLKPGAAFVVTFSNRWFPPKVTRIWEQIHEFERVGLVLEYFYQSQVFEKIGTYSMRGLPRPDNDPYADSLIHADPVYAVWGRRTDTTTKKEG